MLPVLLPGARRSMLPLAPKVTPEDRMVVDNMTKIINFLTRGQSVADVAATGPVTPQQLARQQQLVSDLMPLLPSVASEVLPQLVQRFVSRIGARLVRDVYGP
eukprot:114097-Chlamydomonas_euryale.AAC.2